MTNGQETENIYCSGGSVKRPINTAYYSAARDQRSETPLRKEACTRLLIDEVFDRCVSGGHALWLGPMSQGLSP